VDGSMLKLLVTSDEGKVQPLSLMLSSQTLRQELGDVSPDDAWRAAIAWALLEMETGYRELDWASAENGELQAHGPSLVSLLGDPNSSISLDEGAVAGEFDA
jgi:hypothetical protein